MPLLPYYPSLINVVRISISQLIGLNLVLNFTHGLVPLLVTGNSKTISKLFVRYLSTTIHVTNWFEHDPFDKKSKAYRSLRMVRGMHQNVSNMMNTEAGLQEDGETVLWIPQYGMCHAQFSFVGMMTVFPKQVSLNFKNYLYFFKSNNKSYYPSSVWLS